jgi:hypothetical protein
MTMITMCVRKALFCSAIHLTTQQPADHKKGGDHDDTEYGHRPCFGVFLVIHPWFQKCGILTGQFGSSGLLEAKVDR